MSLKFYEKGYESNYEELLTYYPGFYREVYEMREILKAQGKLADGLENSIEQIYFNNFIDTADAETIGKLETFLHIEYNKARKMEVRRRILKAHFVGYGISSASELKAIVKSYTNADVDIRFEPFDEAGNNMLFIDFQRGAEETLCISDVINLLEERIPAHINWRASVAYKFPTGAGIRRKHYIYNYEFSGTKPDASVIVGIFNQATATQLKSIKHTIKHGKEDTDSCNFSESAVERSKESYSSGYNPEGVLLDRERFGIKKEFDARSGLTATDFSVDYIYCGTSFSQS